MELSEKKYHDSIKEKEDLKSKLELKIKNRTRKASLLIGISNEISENLNNFENEKEIKTTRNNNSTQINMQNNLFSNFKKSAINKNPKIKNNKNAINTMIKDKFNESEEDDIMNNTVNINQKNFSNFAIFNNNNLSSRNLKVFFLIFKNLSNFFRKIPMI